MSDCQGKTKPPSGFPFRLRSAFEIFIGAKALWEVARERKFDTTSDLLKTGVVYLVLHPKILQV
jgi:hypothetical protein